MDYSFFEEDQLPSLSNDEMIKSFIQSASMFDLFIMIYLLQMYRFIRYTDFVKEDHSIRYLFKCLNKICQQYQHHIHLFDQKAESLCEMLVVEEGKIGEEVKVCVQQSVTCLKEIMDIHEQAFLEGGLPQARWIEMAFLCNKVKVFYEEKLTGYERLSNKVWCGEWLKLVQSIYFMDTPVKGNMIEYRSNYKKSYLKATEYVPWPKLYKN